MPERISFAPRDFMSGGLLNDVDVTITKAYTDVVEFRKKDKSVSHISTCLVLKARTPDGEEHQLEYSAGRPESFQPTDDKTGIMGVEGNEDDDGNELPPASKLAKSSNLARFLATLVERGFDEDLLAKGDFSVLAGLKGHIVRMQFDRYDGSKGEVPVFSKIDTSTIGKGGGKGGAAKSRPSSKGSPKSAPKPGKKSEDAGDDPDAITAAAIETAAAKLTEPVDLETFANKVYRAVFANNPKHKNHPEHGDLRAYARDQVQEGGDAFSQAAGELFEFDGDTVSPIE